MSGRLFIGLEGERDGQVTEGNGAAAVVRYNGGGGGRFGRGSPGWWGVMRGCPVHFKSEGGGA
jgi:hypothetical protein